jgi:hypothetical protein
MLLDRKNVDPAGGRASLVDKGLCPSHIVIFDETDFRDVIVDQLSRRILKGGECAAFDARAKPFFLAGSEGHGGKPSYHEAAALRGAEPAGSTPTGHVRERDGLEKRRFRRGTGDDRRPIVVFGRAPR